MHFTLRERGSYEFGELEGHQEETLQPQARKKTRGLKTRKVLQEVSMSI